MDIYRDRRVFRDEDEENEMFKSSIVPGGRATDVYIHQLLLTREMREPKSNVFDFISTVPEVDFLENLKTVMTRVLYHFPYILANDTPRFILGKTRSVRTRLYLLDFYLKRYSRGTSHQISYST